MALTRTMLDNAQCGACEGGPVVRQRCARCHTVSPTVITVEAYRYCAACRERLTLEDVPHDHVLYFHAGCHPTAPTWARYEAGEVVITCSACEQEVCRIAVA